MKSLIWGIPSECIIPTISILFFFAYSICTALVADVDCTTEGKPLCEENGVQGFPTIKWGSPDALEDYEGACCGLSQDLRDTAST